MAACCAASAFRARSLVMPCACRGSLPSPCPWHLHPSRLPLQLLPQPSCSQRRFCTRLNGSVWRQHPNMHQQACHRYQQVLRLQQVTYGLSHPHHHSKNASLRCSWDRLYPPAAGMACRAQRGWAHQTAPWLWQGLTSMQYLEPCMRQCSTVQGSTCRVQLGQGDHR